MISILTVSVTPFNNKPESSRNFTILIRFSISLFDIINVVFPDPNIFICIPASATDAAAVNPGGIKTLLAMVLLHFLLKVILFLVMKNYLQKIYEYSKLVCLLIIIYEEN